MSKLFNFPYISQNTSRILKDANRRLEIFIQTNRRLNRFRSRNGPGLKTVFFHGLFVFFRETSVQNSAAIKIFSTTRAEFDIRRTNRYYSQKFLAFPMEFSRHKFPGREIPEIPSNARNRIGNFASPTLPSFRTRKSGISLHISRCVAFRGTV